MPQLVLEFNGRSRTLESGRTYALGRDPQSDVAFDDARVSWRHATISHDGGSWLLDDHGSTNGTYVDGRRTARALLVPGTVVCLGNAENGPRLSFTAVPGAVGVGAGEWQDAGGHRPAQPPAAWGQQVGAGPAAQPGWGAPQQGTPGMPHQQGAAAFQGGAPVHGGVPPQGGAPSGPGAQDTGVTPVYGDRNPTMIRNLAHGMRTVRIGRSLDNDLVVSDLGVSRHHAELRQLADGRYEIVDLDSHNGTYVNGQPVQRHVMGPEDILGVGHSVFRLVGDQLEEFVDTGEVSFSARHLTVEVDHKGAKKVLLNDVSFGVPEKSLVAVIGPSGSGKSTLLRALTGYRPADRGDVLYDGRNLYKQFAELRQRIGLVPQDDILHKELTVRTALKYAARLRFPGDTQEAERAARVDEVLYELRLDKRADNRITALSGGQRKRVSVALELLTKPSLIFLDEPTSGLDPGMDREVMQMLRGLADDGRTVLVVTHSVAELALCDRLLVMAPGGSVAYFGPPDEALHFFGYEGWADVFQAFENYPDHDWAGRYRGSVHYQMYSADVEAVAPQSAPIVQEQSRPPKPQSWGSQLATLTRRYLSVIAADRGFLALCAILPVVMGAVSLAIPAKFGLLPANPPVKDGQPQFNVDAATVLLIVAVGTVFTGAANSVRELVKERVIYERERATGLSRSAYVMSKILTLGALTAVQSVVLALIGLGTRDLPAGGVVLGGSPLAEMTLAVVLLGLTSMMLGLVISSLVKTSEKTMPLLVLVAIVNVVFCGALFPLFGAPGLEQLAWLAPARWAVGALGASVSLGAISPPPDGKDGSTDPLWDHDLASWALSTGALVVLGLVCAFLVVRLLRRHEPEVMRSR
ncbi:FHA domain-containing protein [Streptomyces sp. NPDC001380]|uniref:FHA domain-containing protein n=1 Tax=Streptomyces sp. NPDC001380 TaxID=3364566 RepID=UPI0036D03B78